MVGLDAAADCMRSLAVKAETMTVRLAGEDLARVSLLSRAEYVRQIRPHLPAEAFRASPRKLWGVAVHSILMLAAVYAIVSIQPWWARLLLAIAGGHSLACLAFFGHDLSHGSVVRLRGVKYALELWVWGLRLMPPTVWRRLHNQVHHAHSNTPLDCDRRALAPEAPRWVRAIGQTLTPFDNPIKWNPFVAFSFVGYTIGHVATAFLPGREHGRSGPYRVAYLRRQRLWIALEIVVIAAWQAGLFALTGFNVATYAWCAIAPLVVSSAVIMAYIFTNHHANAITECEDPLLGTTSVHLPSAIDWLHAHFSYHTEHHLFPSIDSTYYPLVSRLLAEKFPERYNRSSFTAVWRVLWQLPFVGEVEPTPGVR